MAARPAGRQIALPNQTIYINNINDKLSKDLLRRCWAWTSHGLACKF